MTPHGVLEDITKAFDVIGEDFFSVWHPKMLLEALDMLKHAVHFEFGPATPMAEHMEFANDLLSKALFRLPFDTVFITANALPHTAILAQQTVVGGLCRRMHWYTIAPARSGSVDLIMPSLFGELVPKEGETDLLHSGIVNWKSLTTTRHASRKTGRPWVDADYYEASEKVVSFIGGASVLLMSKDVEVTTIEAPMALNKQRARKGRIPVAERRIVRIKLDRRAAYSRAAEDWASGKSSPRMHFRRGHFRTIQRGADTERVVPVAPTIVNATDGAKPIAKTYAVQS